MSGEDEVENERRKRKRKNGVPGMGGGRTGCERDA